MLMPSMHESYPNRIERFHWMKNPLETSHHLFFHFIGQFLERHLGRLIFFARTSGNYLEETKKYYSPAQNFDPTQETSM